MAVLQNSGYSISEFSSMQQDAIQRVREMQRKARERLEESNRMAAAVPPPAPVRQAAAPPPQAAGQRNPPALPFQGLLDSLGMDGETALILILLLLLLNEGADRMVILALVYLLVG